MSQVNNEDPLLTVAEAAAYIRLSRATMHVMQKDGTGPVRVKLGRRVFYRRSDLDNFINDGVFKGVTNDN